MKRFALMILAALMVFVFLSPAGAEMKRGSQGEDVTNLQHMLNEMGFLEDEPDGTFGGNTEDAVKAFQAYCGMSETGKVDDRLLVMILDVYYTAMGDMQGDGLSDEELMEMYPQACSLNGDSAAGAVFCYRHIEESRVSELIWRAGTPEKLKRLLAQRGADLWLMSMARLFNEWEASLPLDQQSVVANQRVAFQQTVTELMADYLSGDDEASVLDAFIYMESYGLKLCHELHNDTQVASSEGDS